MQFFQDIGDALTSPVSILIIGILTVIGLIIFFRVHAFIALIVSALVVSLLAPIAADSSLDKISRVADAFGSSAGKIGIVIAMAAVIGACMMESGAADRIVRGFLALLGQKRSSLALAGSGYVLSIPVFFDTVFYLLVPLARSLFRRTGKNYLLYLVAIGAGAAVTHTLVPPTPGPLLMASALGVDVGLMIIMGLTVALPATLSGLAYGIWINRVMPIPLREGSATPAEEGPPPDDKLPSLGFSLLPVILPVLLISTNTIIDTLTKPTPDGQKVVAVATEESGSKVAIGSDKRSVTYQPKGDFTGTDQFTYTITNSEGEQTTTTVNVSVGVEPEAANENFQVASNSGKVTFKVLPALPGSDTVWRRDVLPYTRMLGNPNIALLVAALAALFVYWRQRSPTLVRMAGLVENALMSGGVIILITAAGGAFGAMLKAAQFGDTIEELFKDSSAQGMMILFVGFGVASLLKIAQGSSTVAMITASGLIAELITNIELPYHPVYLALAIGAGSKVCSWMNDSGFWVFAKMGGLTEPEALKSWTVMLAIMGIVAMGVTLVLSQALPLK